MAILASQVIKRSGLAPAYGAASVGGDKFTPTSETFLHVKNGSGGAITVTVVTPKQALPDVDITDLAVSVPASGERMIGPFPHSDFAEPSDGLASITYSGVTSLTLAAVELSQP